MSTRAPAAAPPATVTRPRAEVLRRAGGVELLGHYEGSGFRRPPLLVRRADGQMVQLTELLYAIVEAADGERDLHAIAGEVSARCGRSVTAANVALLADKRLRPLGVLALPDGSTVPLVKREALMALRHRRPLLSERAVNRGARPLTWLHAAPVTVLVLLALAAFDVWLFGMHGIAGGLRAALYEPILLLAVFGSVVVGTAFHEFGHASACRHGGARPGVMGVGFYLVWPAFYCDVTDAYRLGRGGRLRTDLGGVYFNAIFALGAGAVYFATGEEAALLAAVLQHVIMLQQLLPLLRFDGYYVLTDLTGVPDILSRIRPIFRSLVPGSRPEPEVEELKPWVRFAVTAYLLTLVPTLLFLFTWMVMGAPRLFATVHDSYGLQLDRIGDAGGPAETAVGVLRLLALTMPVLATTLSLTRTGRLAGRGLVRWSRGSAARRAVAIGGAAAVLGGIGYVLWPNGDYEPIRPGERGTIGEAIEALPDIPAGRPSFTPETAMAFGAVPTEREAAAEQRSAERDGRRDAAAREDGDRDARDEEEEELFDLLSDVRDGATLGDDADGGLTGAGDSSTTSAAGAGSTATSDASSTGTQSSPTTTSSGTTTTSGSGTTTTDSGTTTTESGTTTTDSGTTTTESGTTTSPTTTAPDSSTTTDGGTALDGTRTDTTTAPTTTAPTETAPSTAATADSVAPTTTVPADTTTTTTTTTPVP